jgi:hypothetical protein
VAVTVEFDSDEISEKIKLENLQTGRGVNVMILKIFSPKNGENIGDFDSDYSYFAGKNFHNVGF